MAQFVGQQYTQQSCCEWPPIQQVEPSVDILCSEAHAGVQHRQRRGQQEHAGHPRPRLGFGQEAANGSYDVVILFFILGFVAEQRGESQRSQPRGDQLISLVGSYEQKAAQPNGERGLPFNGNIPQGEDVNHRGPDLRKQLMCRRV